MLQLGIKECTFLGMNPHQSGLLGQALDSSAASPSGSLRRNFAMDARIRPLGT